MVNFSVNGYDFLPHMYCTYVQVIDILKKLNVECNFFANFHLSEKKLRKRKLRQAHVIGTNWAGIKAFAQIRGPRKQMLLRYKCISYISSPVICLQSVIFTLKMMGQKYH